MPFGRAKNRLKQLSFVFQYLSTFFHESAPRMTALRADARIPIQAADVIGRIPAVPAGRAPDVPPGQEDRAERGQDRPPVRPAVVSRPAAPAGPGRPDFFLGGRDPPGQGGDQFLPSRPGEFDGGVLAPGQDLPVRGGPGQGHEVPPAGLADLDVRGLVRGSWNVVTGVGRASMPELRGQDRITQRDRTTNR
ncbi:MAG: hypothetical protein JWO38_8222 [Gemmataceae bacterium]|nr:hypothetical protein [Gemmataceae bacterium]